MAKQRHQEPAPNSARNSLIVLTVGGLLVAGLVAWALTRTVEVSRPVTTTAPVLTETQPISTPGAESMDSGSLTPPALDTPTATGVTPPAPAPQVQGDRAAVPRMAAEDLRPKVNRGEVTVIDVRDAAAFAASHIPGSINIPMASMESMFDTIPQGKAIVTYCT